MYHSGSVIPLPSIKIKVVKFTVNPGDSFFDFIVCCVYKAVIVVFLGLD